MGESVVENLDNYIHEMDESDGWPTLFSKLLQQAVKNQSPCTVAKEPESKTRNRYRDVLPADHCRVQLDSKSGESDYINANHVRVDEVGRRYILTQGPLPHTADHFWQMVWEQKSRGIAMLNRVIEKGMRKCHQYFPSNDVPGSGPVEVVEFGAFTIRLVDTKTEGGYVINKLSLENAESDEPAREVLHFHYRKWPDFHLPETAEDFLEYLWAIRKAGAITSDGDEAGSLIVHCSAGIGRTGTLILVDVCLKEIELQGDLPGTKIEEYLMAMRRQRFGLIQTPEQLRFAFLAIAEGVERVDMSTSPEEETGENDTTENADDATENERPAKVADNGEDAEEEVPPKTEEVVSAPATTLASTDAIEAPKAEEEEEEEVKPPCKRHAEDPTVGDEPQAKRTMESLNTAGQAVAGRSTDAHEVAPSSDLQPGPPQPPTASASGNGAAVASPLDTTSTGSSGARARVGARSPELTRKVEDMKERLRAHEQASADSTPWGTYVKWSVAAVVVAGGAWLAYKKFLA